MDAMENKLAELFRYKFSEIPTEIEKLPQSGSYRSYFRLRSMHYNVIGCHNEDTEENEAFIYFSEHLKSKNINVPEIYIVSDDRKYYLQEDFGNTTLYGYIKNNPQEKPEMYRKVLQELVKLQTKGAEDTDWTKGFPVQQYDKEAFMYDLNYFKYFVLKLFKVKFHEVRLQRDFDTLTNYLLSADNNFFVYRDFQSANIMVLPDGKLGFIDYQGARRGAIFYDLASLLYDSKAQLPQQLRNELIEYYFDQTGNIHKLTKEQFNNYFYAYSLVRLLQALAAYGLRGKVENKTRFLQSLPLGLANVVNLLDDKLLFLDLPELKTALRELYEKEGAKTKQKGRLEVDITSFSFRDQGYPPEKHGNGGGFVFDCRGLPNPGRLEQYKNKTGLDKEVIDWLKAKSEVEQFIANVYQILKQTIETYLERDFEHLEISFGCTGGQHRSVYCAETISQMISETFDIKINLEHSNLKNKGFIG